MLSPRGEMMLFDDQKQSSVTLLEADRKHQAALANIFDTDIEKLLEKKSSY